MSTVTILGATGYTGGELANLLLAHPGLEIAHATTTSRAGAALADVHPTLRGRTDVVLEPFGPKAVLDVDAVVSCLPHKQSMQTVAAIAQDDPELPIIDLSADFRFHDPAAYEAAYATTHEAPQLTATAAYGLPELFRPSIQEATLVGNPGCYPTAALVALAPLARAGLLADAIVDAKSGLSGAGATPSPATHFAKANESVTPYKLYAHRHAPEIGVHLDKLAGGAVPLTFTPHLVPMDRGILSTAYATFHEPVDAKTLAGLYEDAYAHEPFVRLLPENELPDTKHTARTNFVDLAFALAPGGRRATVVTALDNLVKGAAGQAVQNLNILLGHPETAGLLNAKNTTKTEVLA